jgi:hypothetical protein
MSNGPSLLRHEQVKYEIQYVYMRYEIYEIVHFFDEQTDQFFTVYSL